MFKKAFFIVNPAAGTPEPVLSIINEVMAKSDLKWEIGITTPDDNIDRLFSQADDFGADLIVGYGGDGTIALIAHKNSSADRPLAILAGGTANVLSHDLLLPQDLREACALIVQPEPQIRKIDLVRINDHHFFTRAGWGFEARMVEQADRETKNRFGNMAYLVSAFRAAADLRDVDFQFTIDDENHQVRGFACIVANCGNLGITGLSLPDVRIDDGQLDVFVFCDGGIGTFGAAVTNLLTNIESEAVRRFRGRRVSVRCSPAEVVQCDGEMLGEVDVDMTLLPGHVQVLVPALRA